MSDKHKPPPPRITPKPYSNGTEHEPPSGVFHVRTGRTRRMVKWGAIIGALAAASQPIINAVAARISPAIQETKVEKELRELRELLTRDSGE